MHKYQSVIGAVEDMDAAQKTTQQATATRQKHDHSEAEMNVPLSTEHQHRQAHKNHLAPLLTLSNNTKSHTQTNSSALKTINEFGEDQLGPQGSGRCCDN